MQPKYLQLSLFAIIVLALLVPSWTGAAGEGAVEVPLPTSPTRSYFEESETNNNWATADKIPITAGTTMELHGNLTNGNDYDFFYFTMNGGRGPVDSIGVVPNYINASSQSDAFVAWFWGFYPNNAMSTADSNSISLALDIWTPASWWWPVSIAASYTGNYGLIIRPADPAQFSGKMFYNFTITMSSVTPRDQINDEGSAQELSKGVSSISGDLATDMDLFDWFHVTAPSMIHPTVLDLVLSLSNPSPDYNDGTFDWGVEVDVYVKWDSRSSPGDFQNSQKYRVASSSRTLFINDGCTASPLSIKIQKNCTEMYVGLMVQTYGINSLRQRTYNTWTGSVSFVMNTNMYGNIPNKRPQLLNAVVDRSKGISSDKFTFSVTYRDQQNESAKIVELWKDGVSFKRMSPVLVSGENNILGVRYETEVLGSQIGSDGDYSFNISASDGKDWAVDPQSGIRIFNVRIDNNLPPESNMDRLDIDVREDPEPIWIQLDNLFRDQDIDSKLTYSLLHPDGTFRGSNYILRGEGFKATLINNGSQVLEEWRLLIEVDENVNGQLPIVINATDEAVFTRSAEITVLLDIEPVNDPPIIKRVGSVDTTKFKTADFYNLDQGELEEISVIAEDIDQGDVLKFTWDIGDVLSSGQRGTAFDWDQTTGKLWFTTTDGDVPGFETKIVVSDGSGGTDTVLVSFEIDNVNDPPTIKVPSQKSTIEGEYLYINPTYNDPDLDSGDIISFTYTMGALERLTPSTAIEFSQTTGRLVLKAVNDQMNGEWEINITVVDLFGLADWGICKITIGNVNDPPVAYPINIEQLDENLTVIFHTLEAEDEDGEDELSYIWDFGDGSEIEQDVNLRDISHTFPAAGAYTVTLTVFDGESRSEMKEIIVTVTAPPPDPDPDNDGMTSVWEIKYGLNPNDPTDADMDYDEDGLTNLEEFEYYLQHGIYLNPRNPDSDGDGYKDGEEIRNNYDPLDASLHPEDPNRDLTVLLWLGALVLILLSLLAGVVFGVMKIRNRPKPFASPSLSPTPAYEEIGAVGYYEQLPVSAGAMLPPGDMSYAQGDYQDQEYLPPVQGEQYWEQPLEQYAQDQYSEDQDPFDQQVDQPIQNMDDPRDNGPDQVIDNIGVPTMEETLDQVPQGQMEPIMDQRSISGATPDEIGIGETIEIPPPEEGEGQAPTSENKVLPPPPSLPDI